MRHGRKTQPRVECLETRDTPATLFVSPTGSDAVPGTDPNAPLLTLQKAANLCEPGDTVIVRAGTYAGFYLDDRRHRRQPHHLLGRPAAPSSSTRPTRQPPPTASTSKAPTYVTIEGFTVTGMPRAGIRSVLNHHVAIRNNVCDAEQRSGASSPASATTC